MAETRIHLGCGPYRLHGWVNLDIQYFPSVDVLCDVRCGLPFSSAQYIFAEHFIEHFGLAEAVALMTSCRRLLDPKGVMRLSTPNLDWVWATCYSTRWEAASESTAVINPVEWRHDARSTVDCIELNKAFHAWGHEYLFNRSMLEECLWLAGFSGIEWCTYGKSEHVSLAGLERHPKDRDIAGVEDLLIVEASGLGEHRSSPFVGERIAEYCRKTKRVGEGAIAKAR